MLVLWRRGEEKAKYEWLENSWAETNNSMDELKETLSRLLSANEVRYPLFVPEESFISLQQVFAVLLADFTCS